MILPIDLVYFSKASRNTERFVEKLTEHGNKIPINWDDKKPFMHGHEYVLVVPTYGGGHEDHAIPIQVRKFLNIPSNRQMLRGVIGTGNTNFGDNFCLAAEQIVAKTGVPLIAKVELFGTDADVEKVIERLRLLYEYEL